MSIIKAATVTPETVLAGDSVQFRIQLIAGAEFSANGSRIIVDLPANIGYSSISRFHVERPGYMEVVCSNPDIRYAIQPYDMEVQEFVPGAEKSFLGKSQRLAVIDFEGTEACEDDEINIYWGFTNLGFGTGARATTNVPWRDYTNTIWIRYFEDVKDGLPDWGRSFKGYDRPQPQAEVPVSFRIEAREPDRLRVITKADRKSLLVNDRFFNIANVENVEGLVEASADPTVNEYGVFHFPKATAISSKGLPITESPDTQDVFDGFNIYFGDTHSHSCLSVDVIERERMEMTPEQMFNFARNVSQLDFFTVTDHHHPWDTERFKIGEENWDQLVETTRKLTKPNEFIAVLGHEFRCARGDTIVLHEKPCAYSEITDPAVKDIRDLWERLKNEPILTIPHFHNSGTLEDGEWFYCPYDDMEPVMEIFSVHGSYERVDALEYKPADIKVIRRDRNGVYFLKERKHRYGLLCSSDDHKGHPGYNGLVGLYAKELTTESLFEALRKRRIYGTTNARIRLLFTVNDQLMGSEIENTEQKKIHMSVQGERPFKAVDLFRNGDLYQRFRPNTQQFEETIVVDEGAPSDWYMRAIQTDNHMAFSSPVWCD